MIDSYLKQSVELDDHTIHLLFSANRWEVFKKMKDLLLSGSTLIVDRYAYSGVAFTAAKGLDVEWCRQPDVGLIKPDKVIYMMVSGDCASQRSQFGEERYEKLDFQVKVKNVFKQLEDPDYWQVVNGDVSVDEVHSQVYQIASETINGASEKPLLKLWTDGTVSQDK
ncbi:thymidylate kinase [Aplysia californica]|uniref:dTMP kinase n=1 Tax=Aplysia californica TaxID=6500 RepID=A0ABM0JRB7_APLCA|nr:thymidylate kinase [Aplysia californica]